MGESGLRVLVVDDEPAIRRFLHSALTSHAHSVFEASGGQEALSLVVTHRPDLVILDLGLPDMDGIEVTRRLREWTSIPIIILSVRGAESDKIAALDAGADDYLTKPFGAGELMARMRVVMRHVAPEADDAVFSSGELTVDLARRLVAVGGEGDPAHPHRIRPAPAPGHTCRQGADSHPTPAPGVGAGLRAGSPHPACERQQPAAKARTGPFPAALSHHRARRRVPSTHRSTRARLSARRCGRRRLWSGPALLDAKRPRPRRSRTRPLLHHVGPEVRPHQRLASGFSRPPPATFGNEAFRRRWKLPTQRHVLFAAGRSRTSATTAARVVRGTGPHAQGLEPQEGWDQVRQRGARR